MADEPVFKRLVMGFMRRRTVGRALVKQPPEQLSPEIVAFAQERALPLQDVRDSFAEYLARPRERQNVFKQLYESRRRRLIAKFDEADALALEGLFKKQAATLRAWTDREEALHDAKRSPQRLSQKSELEDAQHETRLLEERSRQGDLRMKGLDRKRQRIQFREEIEQIRRKKQSELEKPDAPAAEVYDKWGELLRFFKTEVVGAEDFASAAEESLAEFEAKRRAGIGEDDPRREAKVTQLESMLGQMRKTLSQLVRDMWGKK